MDYLKGFFSKRFSKILYPYLAFLVVYSVIDILFLGQSFVDILERFRWGDPVSNSWYVLAILIFYVLFYFANKIKDGKYSVLLITVFIVAYIIIMIVLQKFCSEYFCICDWFYTRAILFPLGCLFGKYRNNIDDILRKKYWIIFTIAGAMSVFGIVFPAIYNKVFARFITIDKWMAQDILISIFVTLFIMLLARKVSVNNKITSKLGKYSFEIYLIHTLVIECISKIFEHKVVWKDELFTILVVAISLLMAVPLKMLFDFVTKITSRKKIEKT